MVEVSQTKMVPQTHTREVPYTDLVPQTRTRSRNGRMESYGGVSVPVTRTRTESYVITVPQKVHQHRTVANEKEAKEILRSVEEGDLSFLRDWTEDKPSEWKALDLPDSKPRLQAYPR